MTITTLHETTFEYQRPIHAAFSETRLCPVSDVHQSCREFSLSVSPDAPITTGTDYFGNTLHSFNILEAHTCAVVTARSIIDLHREPFRVQEPLSEWEIERARVDFLGFDGPIENIPPVRELSRRAGLDARGMSQEQVMGTMRQSQTIFTDWFSAAQKLNGLIYSEWEYAPQSTEIDTKISDVFATKRGVCQDFAHVFIAACRAAGIPARYVSGYIITKKSRGAEGGFATHAWAEALLPGGNWVGFDPTNNLLANNFYVKLATGRDYRDIAPTRGVYRGQPGESRIVVRIYTSVEGEEIGTPQPELVG